MNTTKKAKKLQITTKTGDKGTTSIYIKKPDTRDYSLKRISKHSDEIILLGKVDTLHASLGLVHQYTTKDSGDRNFGVTAKEIVRYQKVLTAYEFNINREELDYLDKQIESLKTNLQKRGYEMSHWIIYGVDKPAISAQLDFARAMCREAECWIWMVHPNTPILGKYFNRLSDCLFLWARLASY